MPYPGPGPGPLEGPLGSSGTGAVALRCVGGQGNWPLGGAGADMSLLAPPIFKGLGNPIEEGTCEEYSEVGVCDWFRGGPWKKAPSCG